MRLMLIIVSALIWTSSAAGQTSRLAIWKLKPLGIDEPTAERLEGLLRKEASRVPGIQLLTGAEVEAALKDTTGLRDCGGESECLCTLGQALGVDLMVTGVIGALRDDYTFDLKLVNVQPCREDRRINEPFSGEERVLILGVRQVLYKLVAPQLFLGSLSVDVPTEGAQVFIDGERVGDTPLAEKSIKLRPGEHPVRIIKSGFPEFEEKVPVRFQQITRVRVDLVRSALTGLSIEQEHESGPEAAGAVTISHGQETSSRTWRIVAWSLGGLALVAAGTGGVLGWRSGVLKDDIKYRAEHEWLDASDQDTYDQGVTLATLANVGFITAGIAAVASTVIFILDPGGESSPASDSVEIQPVIGQDSAGASLRIGF